MYELKAQKTRETNEPECSHVKHFCETSFLNSLTFYQIPPVTVPVHCRQWNVEGVGVPSVECEESGELSGECSVSVKWGLWSVECKG